MKIKKKTFFLIVIFVCSLSVYTQTISKKAAVNSDSPKSNAQTVKSTAAYAELLLRKTERESELEEFLLSYTEEFPKVKELRFEINLLQKETDKILAVSVSEAGKLTLALGKLILRKIELETDLWNLRRQYADDRAEVKRAKRKIEVFDKAIKEILP